MARGWAATTIAGGRVVYDAGEVVADAPAAAISRRELSRLSRALAMLVRPHVAPRPLPALATCSPACKVAEDVGFEFMWFGDSHLIWHEVGPYLTAAAMSHDAACAWARSSPTR